MKSKLKLFSLPVIAFLIIVVSSCKTKVVVTPTPTIPFYQLSDEFKSYCLFQPGTTWEYYSSSTNDTSSMNVTEIQENKWLDEFDEVYNYQAFDMIMDINNLGISMIEVTAGSTLNAVNTMNSLMWVFFSNGDYRLVLNAKYPMGEEQILGEHEGLYTNVEIIPSMFVQQIEYSDVYHTKVVDYFNQGFGDYDFYFAKTYGLIKIQNIINSDTSIVELVSSSTIQ